MTGAVTHVVLDTLDTGKPYSTATTAHGFVFLSGLIPVADSGDISAMSLREQITAVLGNVDQVLRACGGSGASIVKSTCYLVEADHFATFNEVYAEHFVTPFPARTTVVTRLPAPGALFEMDVVAALDDHRAGVSAS